MHTYSIRILVKYVYAMHEYYLEGEHSCLSRIDQSWVRSNTFGTGLRSSCTPAALSECFDSDTAEVSYSILMLSGLKAR
jgi:hypothetical protein